MRLIDTLVQKFNPHHDTKGRFASASEIASPGGVPAGMPEHGFAPGSRQANIAERLAHAAAGGVKGMMNDPMWIAPWLRPYNNRLWATITKVPLPPAKAHPEHEKLLAHAVGATTATDPWSLQQLKKFKATTPATKAYQAQLIRNIESRPAGHVEALWGLKPGTASGPKP